MADGQRVAFISGAARGIGLAIAEAFLADGYRVAIGDRDLDEATASAGRLDPGGERALAVDLDVTERTSVDRAIAATTGRFGRLDALINVAGTIDPEASESITDERWSGLLAVHLDGTMRCCRAAHPALSASPAPAIVSISSVAATVGIPKRASYSAAKGAIEALTRVLAVEWAEAGIRVNAVAPGYTMTKRMEGTISSGPARRVAGHAADPARPLRATRGDRRRRALSRLRGCELHHRADAVRGRRHDGEQPLVTAELSARARKRPRDGGEND